MPETPADDSESPSELEDGIRIEITPDGTVRIHAQCQPGQSPEECQERVKFLIDALGVPEDGVDVVLEDGVVSGGQAPQSPPD